MTVIDELSKNLLVGDGSMGTYLHQYGVPVSVSPEELNLTHPEIVKKVHMDYLQAGARLLETNTYGANREKLAKVGLEDKMLEMNRAAAREARSAVNDFLQLNPGAGSLYVMGAVGGISGGHFHILLQRDFSDCYREQCEVLLESGVDGFLLETFCNLAEVMLVIRAVRELDSRVPIIAQLSVQESGRTQDGVTVAESFLRMKEAGADVMGLNCYNGPATTLRILEEAALPSDWLVSVFPNAGLPAYVDGAYEYAATPEYFAESALHFRQLGINLFGGCCGTTPQHIAAVSQAFKGLPPLSRDNDRSSSSFREKRAKEGGRIEIPRRAAGRVPEALPVETRDKSIQVGDKQNDSAGSFHAPPQEISLAASVRQRYTVIVELDPPKDLEVEPFLTGAQALKEAGADAVTLADNSLAMTRMSNMALASLMLQQVGMTPLVHMACRDRNLIGQQSHLMGLHALGIHHVLVVTGDPSRYGDLPGASSVYDINSFEMIRLIKKLNEGLAFSGKELKTKSCFEVAGAFNPNVKNLPKAVERMERKVASGADFIMTQPIYDPAVFGQLYQLTQYIEVPIFVGIMPLTSYRNAVFLHNEVPGIQLSPSVMERMSRFEGEAARQQGVEIAQELMEEAMRYFRGIYLITPFLRYEMTEALTRQVKGREACKKAASMNN